MGRSGGLVQSPMVVLFLITKFPILPIFVENLRKKDSNKFSSQTGLTPSLLKEARKKNLHSQRIFPLRPLHPPTNCQRNQRLYAFFFFFFFFFFIIDIYMFLKPANSDAGTHIEKITYNGNWTLEKTIFERYQNHTSIGVNYLT